MIPVSSVLLDSQERENLLRAVESGWISSRGEFIEQFEKKFASYIGVKHGVATMNGTAALHIALVALGIGPGDEVITPSSTFVATANVILYVGAKPVFADSHPKYWCINPDALSKLISRRTKAIIPVHIYGHPCDMDKILELSKKHGLYVVEDCAEAHGSLYKQRMVGSFGNISCFSFYGNKTVTTGEGGMCLTNDDDLAEKVRILINQGMDPEKKYWHPLLGFNYRITNLQAAIGVAQMSKIESIIRGKKDLTKAYREQLKSIRGLSFQAEMRWANTCFWMNSIVVEKPFPLDRDQLSHYLYEKGIETRPLFPPVHRMPYMRQFSTGPLTVCEELSARGLCLPSGSNLTIREIEYVCEAVSSCVSNK